MLKEALLGCSALMGIAAAMGPYVAIAQGVSVVMAGGASRGNFTAHGSAIHDAAAAYRDGDTWTIDPGPSTNCVGTLAAGATTCVLAVTSPYAVGDAIIIRGAEFPTDNGIVQPPFVSRVTAVSGSTITWGVPTRATTAASPPVQWDYDEQTDNGGNAMKVFLEYSGTINCNVVKACRFYMTHATDKGVFMISQGPEAPNLHFNGLDIEMVASDMAFASKGQTVCQGILFAGQPIHMTLCPDQPWQFNGGNASPMWNQGGGSITLTNMKFAYINSFVGDPWIEGDGGVDLESSEVHYGGTGGGQEHDLYIGRVHDGIINNSTLDFAYNGHDFKCRAVNCTITNNHLGNASPFDFSSGQATFPDPGNVILTGNIIEHGVAATNGTPIQYQGVVIPWPNRKFFAANNTIHLHKTGQKVILWNNQIFGTIATGGTCQVDFRNNTITDDDGTFNPANILVGLGCQSGNTYDGTIVSSSTLTQYALNGVPGYSSPTCDFNVSPTPCAAATSPYTVPVGANNAIYIGDPSHRLTITDPVTIPQPADVVGGAGGTTIKFSPNPTFLDHVGDAPSTITVPSITGAGNQYLSADGDILNIGTPGHGNYTLIGGANIVVNGSNPGIIEMKSGEIGKITSATINSNTAISAKYFNLSGGTTTITGPFTNPVVYGFCSLDTIVCPNGVSTHIFNNMTLAKTVPFTVSGTVTGEGYNGSALSTSYTMGSVAYPGRFNWFYNLNGPWGIGLGDVTWYIGAGNGGSASSTFNLDVASQLSDAIIPGPGSGTDTMAAVPTILEMVNGYGGGTLTVKSYNTIQPVTFLGYPSNPASPGVVSGGIETVTMTDNTKLILPGFAGTINTTKPAGSNDLVLTVPGTRSVATQATVALAGISATDSYALNHSGLMLLKESVTAGRLIAPTSQWGPATVSVDGKSLTALLPKKGIDQIFATQSYVAGAANAALTVDLSNQGGVEQVTTESLQITSSNTADMVITGPTFLSTNPGGSIAINNPPYVISDPYSLNNPGTMHVTVTDDSTDDLIMNGTVFPTGTIAFDGSVTAVNTKLATLSYLNAGNLGDRIVLAGTNQAGFTQSFTTAVQAIPSNDLILTAPTAAAGTALIPLAMTGTLDLNILDGQQSLLGGAMTMKLDTTFGSITMNGTSFGQHANISDTIDNLNADLNTLRFTFPTSGSGSAVFDVVNTAGFEQTETIAVSAIAQSVSTDLVLGAPLAITLLAGGTAALSGAGITSLWSQTTPGPLTVALSAAQNGLIYNGNIIAAGTPGTFTDSYSDMQAHLASIQVVAGNSANCDVGTITVTDQGGFAATKLISINTVGNAFSIAGPTALSGNVGDSLPVTGIQLIDNSPSGQSTVTVTDQFGSIILGGTTYPAPVSKTFIDTQANLNPLLATLVYLLPAAPHVDPVQILATDATGSVASKTTTISTISGPTGCPLPP